LLRSLHSASGRAVAIDPRKREHSEVTLSVTTTEVDANQSKSTTWQRIAGELDGSPRVLAVFNHKGGTAKTTTSITLAAGLASCDRRVLLVDADAQGNVAVSLDINSEKTLYHVLVQGQDPREAIVNIRPNLDVLPSNETLAAAELYLAGRQRRDRVLAARLESLRAEYDHIIVDCSPSLSLMNQNALVFADALLCPVACDYLSLIGVRQVLRTIRQINRVLLHPVRLWGVLPTFYDGRARVCTDALSTLRQHFGDRCLEPIRVASRVKEAPSLGRTLFEHAGDSTAARDYLRVIARLLSEAESPVTLSETNLSVAS
jgi:chromosome partitioning protein